jgi:hypothetical protein
MIVTEEHKTFCELKVSLTPWCGKEEPTATFCHITYVNINWVKCKWKITTYFKFLYIKDGVLLVRYRRNGLSEFVGVLTAKWACARNPVSNCFTCMLTSKTPS